MRHFGTAIDPWILTQAMSPRSRVRVDSQDIHGQWTHTYAGSVPVEETPPVGPWAVMLADEDGMYRLAGFDLDTKKGDPAAQAEELATLLERFGAAPVVCQSGPGGGRHVWVRLDDGLDATTMAAVARILRGRFPALDITPLTNPSTGCLRPPGAPHRHGGVSTVVSGDPWSLTVGSITGVQLVAMAQSVAPPVHQPAPRLDRRVSTDRTGMPWLPGPRTALPAVTQQGTDMSQVAWRILCAAARHHWTFSEVAQLVQTGEPWLEHFRTRRDGSRRRPRPTHGQNSPIEVLRRMWRSAVEHVATMSGQGFDPTYQDRSTLLAGRVGALWEQMLACPGRWAAHGGPSDKRVLAGVLLLCLAAVSEAVEADLRRLALMTGVSRETVRRALARLCADGWLIPADKGQGAHGDTWKLPPNRVIHREEHLGVSQVITPPEGMTFQGDMATLCCEIQGWLSGTVHDVFTGRGLGIVEGNVYSQLVQGSWDEEELGIGIDAVDRVLDRLCREGLAEYRAGVWYGRETNLALLSSRVQTTGVLERRRVRYGIEREQWAWWQAELDRLRSPRRNVWKRVRDEGIVYPRSGKYPDHKAALRLLWDESPEAEAMALTVVTEVLGGVEQVPARRRPRPTTGTKPRAGASLRAEYSGGLVPSGVDSGPEFRVGPGPTLFRRNTPPKTALSTG